MLFLLEELMQGESPATEIDELRSLSLSITRQLNAWLESLKKTKAVGHRQKTVERREVTENVRRREEYLASLKKVEEAARTGQIRSDEESES